MPTALVVDDQIGVRELYTIFLEGIGFTVEGAATGTAAIRQCLALRPDVLVLDLTLPDMTGLDVLRTVGRTGLPSTIIVVSGHLDPTAQAEALELGATACLEKPFRLAELQAALRVFASQPASTPSDTDETGTRERLR